MAISGTCGLGRVSSSESSTNLISVEGKFAWIFFREHGPGRFMGLAWLTHIIQLEPGLRISVLNGLQFEWLGRNFDAGRGVSVQNEFSVLVSGSFFRGTPSSVSEVSSRSPFQHPYLAWKQFICEFWRNSLSRQ